MAFGAYLLNPDTVLVFQQISCQRLSAKIGGPAYKNFSMSRQYYLFGSYDFSLGTSAIIQPSFLFKMSEQVKPQVDIGATYIYNQGFWAGLGLSHQWSFDS